SCASRSLSEVARRAYRRDLTAGDLDPLMKAYTRYRASHGFEESVAEALTLVLVSPDFLFRLETVSDFELASRLSFFLWSSIPDDELLGAARAGKLRDKPSLRKQVVRMLADSRSETLTGNFATQWL